ncbi:hypothetical protein BpHYR1_028366 [Brachionus plicatilis]|uniref:Uncharacterized protein n=1 Tax=Brachionus plicatilis TaxID=10195 RepID=A0A3M7T5X9_BRAPC|nr:hypothetical protein BpHYR1_028366 [Brachionus plicatilis]
MLYIKPFNKPKYEIKILDHLANIIPKRYATFMKYSIAFKANYKEYCYEKLKKKFFQINGVNAHENNHLFFDVLFDVFCFSTIETIINNKPVTNRLRSEIMN